MTTQEYCIIVTTLDGTERTSGWTEGATTESLHDITEIVEDVGDLGTFTLRDVEGTVTAFPVRNITSIRIELQTPATPTKHGPT